MSEDPEGDPHGEGMIDPVALETGKSLPTIKDQKTTSSP